MTHRARARARARRWTRDTSTPFRHAFPSAYLFRDVSSVHVQAGGRGTPPPASPIPARTTPSRVTGTPASRACPPARNPRSRNRAPITGWPAGASPVRHANVENVENVENRGSVLRGARGRFTRVSKRAPEASSRRIRCDGTVYITRAHDGPPPHARTLEHRSTMLAKPPERNVTSRSSPRSRPRGSPSPRPPRMPSSRQSAPRPRRAPRSR